MPEMAYGIKEIIETLSRFVTIEAENTTIKTKITKYSEKKQNGFQI